MKGFDRGFGHLTRKLLPISYDIRRIDFWTKRLRFFHIYENDTNNRNCQRLQTVPGRWTESYSTTPLVV